MEKAKFERVAASIYPQIPGFPQNNLYRAIYVGKPYLDKDNDFTLTQNIYSFEYSEIGNFVQEFAGLSLPSAILQQIGTDYRTFQQFFSPFIGNERVVG
jgi:hypothetical protein